MSFICQKMTISVEFSWNVRQEKVPQPDICNLQKGVSLSRQFLDILCIKDSIPPSLLLKVTRQETPRVHHLSWIAQEVINAQPWGNRERKLRDISSRETRAELYDLKKFRSSNISRLGRSSTFAPPPSRVRDEKMIYDRGRIQKSDLLPRS